MYFTKIRLAALTNIDLPIFGAKPSDAYIVKNVDGLGPPEVDVSISNTLYQGGVYQGRRPQSREVVIQVGLNPDYTTGQRPADLRSALYGLLSPMSSDQITIQLLNGANVVAQTVGYVSKMESSPFNKDPEVQITVACLQPYLQAASDKLVNVPSDASEAHIINEGTAPTGVHVEVVFNSSQSYWFFTNQDNTQPMLIDYPFISGDRLIIETQPGQRGIFYTRNGTTYNIIKALSSDSVWRSISGGDNLLVGPDDQSYSFDIIRYRPQYWGV